MLFNVFINVHVWSEASLMAKDYRREKMRTKIKKKIILALVLATTASAPLLGKKWVRKGSIKAKAVGNGWIIRKDGNKNQKEKAYKWENNTWKIKDIPTKYFDAGGFCLDKWNRVQSKKGSLGTEEFKVVSQGWAIGKGKGTSKTDIKEDNVYVYVFGEKDCKWEPRIGVDQKNWKFVDVSKDQALRDNGLVYGWKWINKKQGYGKWEKRGTKKFRKVGTSGKSTFAIAQDEDQCYKWSWGKWRRSGYKFVDVGGDGWAAAHKTSYGATDVQNVFHLKKSKDAFGKPLYMWVNVFHIGRRVGNDGWILEASPPTKPTFTFIYKYNTQTKKVKRQGSWRFKDVGGDGWAIGTNDQISIRDSDSEAWIKMSGPGQANWKFVSVGNGWALKKEEATDSWSGVIEHFNSAYVWKDDKWQRRSKRKFPLSSIGGDGWVIDAKKSNVYHFE